MACSLAKLAGWAGLLLVTGEVRCGGDASLIRGRGARRGFLVGETVDTLGLLIGETVVVVLGLFVGDSVVVRPKLSSFIGTAGRTVSRLDGVRTGASPVCLVVAESADGLLGGDDGVCTRCGNDGKAVNSPGEDRGVVLLIGLVR